MWYKWDAAFDVCRINCPIIAKATKVPSGPNSCTCLPKYKWVPNYISCLIDCTKFPNSDNVTAATGGGCGCVKGYSWASEALGCVSAGSE